MSISEEELNKDCLVVFKKGEIIPILSRTEELAGLIVGRIRPRAQGKECTYSSVIVVDCVDMNNPLKRIGKQYGGVLTVRKNLVKVVSEADPLYEEYTKAILKRKLEAAQVHHHYN